MLVWSKATFLNIEYKTVKTAVVNSKTKRYLLARRAKPIKPINSYPKATERILDRN